LSIPSFFTFGFLEENPLHGSSPIRWPHAISAFADASWRVFAMTASLGHGRHAGMEPGAKVSSTCVAGQKHYSILLLRGLFLRAFQDVRATWLNLSFLAM